MTARRRKHGLQRLLGDLFVLAREERKWWLLPLLVTVVVLAGLMLLAALTGPLSPFFYPLL